MKTPLIEQGSADNRLGETSTTRHQINHWQQPRCHCPHSANVAGTHQSQNIDNASFWQCREINIDPELRKTFFFHFVVFIVHFFRLLLPTQGDIWRRGLLWDQDFFFFIYCVSANILVFHQWKYKWGNYAIILSLKINLQIQNPPFVTKY